jgi:hypothetical protein
VSSHVFSTKAPADLITYTLDWTPWLPTGDEIATVTWDVPVGLVNVGETNTTVLAKITLTGGTPNDDYDVVCQITTVLGAVGYRTVTIPVRDL